MVGNQYPMVPLGEIADVFDHMRIPVKKADRRPGPYPYYGASGIVDYVDSYIFEGEYLLLAEDGENLRAQNTPIAFMATGKFWVNNHAHILKGNARSVTRFLCYALQAADVRSYLSGSTRPKLTQGDMKRIPIHCPPVDTQEAIARILGALDDKIELNRRMNETLEEIARAIFKSWFVDFDPVWAKAAGQQPAGLAPHIVDLFPDAFEESELGEIPKGWEVGTVGEDFDITMGQSPPGETYNEDGEGLPFYQGRRDFGFRYPSLRVYCTAPTRFAKPGDTLVSVRAPVGDINMAIEDCCVGRGVAAVRHKTGSRSYTYYAMQSLRTLFDRFEAEGTVFGSLNKRDFHNLPFLIPPTQVVAKFEQQLFPIDQLIETSEQQVQTLAELRDTLLPKLISGELRVPDAERIVGRHV